jgi:DNA-directed RNA polymerases I and III subunit RPAC1
VVEDPFAYRAYGVDNSLTLESFKKKFRIKINKLSDEEVQFDMVGADAPLANALRRILIAEIPTMAIERVNLYQNTSIIPDEVLVHRLGLIPIHADPRKFEWCDEHDRSVAANTAAFSLQVECKRKKNASAYAPAEEHFENGVVLSSALKWEPQGSQARDFADDPIRPVHDDIIVAKLRPGQVIEAELLCVKGLGATHTKWSAVATAAYRLLPDVIINKPFFDEEADKLKACCPTDVFDIEDMGNQRRAVVARPRNCTMCRECIRNPRDKLQRDDIILTRVKDHFIFSIESVGQYKAPELLKQALLVLKNKCNRMLKELGNA